MFIAANRRWVEASKSTNKFHNLIQTQFNTKLYINKILRDDVGSFISYPKILSSDRLAQQAILEFKPNNKHLQTHTENLNRMSGLLIDAVIHDKEKRFGTDPSGWESITHSYDLSEVTFDGHAQINVSYQPLENIDKFNKNNNIFFNILIPSISGGAAMIPKDLYFKVLTNALVMDRQIDGTPVNILDWKSDPKYLEFLETTEKSLSQSSQIQSFWSLGSQSMVYVVNHQILNPQFQYLLFSTTDIHALRGVAFWICHLDARYPNGAFFVSIHLGKNSVPFVDSASSYVTPFLFKNMYQRAADVWKLYDPDKTSRSILESEEYKKNMNPEVAMDSYKLKVLDSTGGYLSSILGKYASNPYGPSPDDF